MEHLKILEDTQIADEIASLDQLCMPGIMSAHGETFDAARRAINLRKCLAGGDNLITVHRDSLLIGYALVSGTTECGFTITSLQIRPNVSAISRGFILRKLMNEMMQYLTACPDEVTVAVETHPGNYRSTSLTAKLGFRPVTSSRKNRSRFQQTLGGLREKLNLFTQHSPPGL